MNEHRPAAAAQSASARAAPAAPQVAFGQLPDSVRDSPPGADRTASGLASKVLRPGRGKVHPRPGDRVKAHYIGWTAQGRVFADTTEAGGPQEIRLDRVIPGWSEGIQLMVVGEQRRLWIPAELAYGEQPARAGEPAGPLAFDVELVEIMASDLPAVPEDVDAPPASSLSTGTGLSYRVLKKGFGDRSPGPTDTVVIHYTGWTTEGRMFDSSYSQGGPAALRVDALIQGLIEGLQLMVEGAKHRFWIPSSLAYGHSPGPGQPAGMLVFDVELLEIR